MRCPVSLRCEHEHARIEAYSFVGPVEVECRRGSNAQIGAVYRGRRVGQSEDGGTLAELILVDGRRVPVENRPWSSAVYRSAGSCLQDTNVSRRHAEVRRTGEEIVVTDLGSTNGTRVNGTPVRRRFLASGDEVSVGSTQIVFEMS